MRTITALAATAALSAAGVSIASSTQSPYLVRSEPGVVTKAILSAGESAPNGYRLVGVPDGLGAFDNGDGTFTVLMNHELTDTEGAVRAHGAKGAFVSKWVVSKDTLEVLEGEDLIRQIALWNGSGYAAPATGVALSRLCSATLAAPSAFGGIRLFTDGEEVANGRALAHQLDGTSYEIPRIGRLAHENVVPREVASERTIVATTDDSTPGQVYVYAGDKQASGLSIDRAGLTDGKLYAVKVDGVRTESRDSGIASGTHFSTIDLGDVSNLSGAQLETASDNAGATEFLRPEDGAWDTQDPNRFYFVTTDRFGTSTTTARSRLWALDFADAEHPENGGTISELLDGTEGQQMLDNLAVDPRGRVILQEDPGNQPYVARIWRYEPSSDRLVEIAHHDPARFTDGGAQFLTHDEESSGVIAAPFLGEGWYLADDQAHYAFGDPEIVEGGQLLALHVPPGRK